MILYTPATFLTMRPSPPHLKCRSKAGLGRTVGPPVHKASTGDVGSPTPNDESGPISFQGPSPQARSSHSSG